MHEDSPDDLLYDQLDALLLQARDRLRTKPPAALLADLIAQAAELQQDAAALAPAPLTSAASLTSAVLSGRPGHPPQG